MEAFILQDIFHLLGGSLKKIIIKLRANEIKKLCGWVSLALEIEFSPRQGEK